MFKLPPLYIILDNTFFEKSSIKELVKSLLDGGARFFQLRVKNKPSGEFLEIAKVILPLIHSAGGKLVINDRVDIAMLSGADGVHLGQDDIPLEKVLKIFKGKIIGISTHNIEEALKAEDGGATYIGFGPVFQTATKKDAAPVKGLKELEKVVKNVDIPVVGIGGITRMTFPEVLKAGAAGAAVISAVLKAEFPGREVKSWIEDFKK